MKLHVITAACVAGIACTAQAQSSVVLFGVADAAVRHVDNEGSGTITSLVSGAGSTSRLGFRGSEDLGRGLAAGFWLEHGIALDSGTPAGGNTFFDRRATLSLVSKSLGELRFGRDYTPTYIAWSRHDPFSHVGVAGSNNVAGSGPTGPIRAAFGSNPNTTVRASNSGQYVLPGGLGGFEGVLMVAAGEGGTLASGANKLQGLRLGWAGGGFGVVAALAETTNEQTGTGNKFKDTVLGGNAAFGPVKLTLVWRQFEYTTAKHTNTLLGVVWGLGSGEVKASYIRANLSGRVGSTVIDGNDATQIGLGYVHHLSKRSALYATLSRLDNEGAGSFVIPGGPALVPGRTSTGVEAGLRHNF